MKVVPVTVGPVRFSGVPSLNSCASTNSNESSDSITAGPNSAVQVTEMWDPIERIVPLGSFVIVTEDGVGTIKINRRNSAHDTLKYANRMD